jgi:uncharacterized protein
LSVFVDTGVLVAHLNSADPSHEAARGIIDAITAGDLGFAVTSEYVFDEAVTLSLARTRRPASAVRVGEFILGMGPEGRILTLARVTPRVFFRSWAAFLRYSARGLSFTDCTSIEIVRRLRIDEIASFDHDFDGIVPRRSSVRDLP